MAGTPSIREVPTPVQVSNASGTVNLSSAVQAGDSIAIWHGTNVGTYASLTAPASGTWAAFGTYTSAATRPHVKAWLSTLEAGGAQSVVFPQAGSAQHNCLCMVFVGEVTLDPAGGAGLIGASEGSHDAPSVSPADAAALLVCCSQARGPDASTDYTTPAGMTARAEFTGTNPTLLASQVLSSSGATGVRTFVQAGGTWDEYAAISAGFVAAAGPAYVRPTILVSRAAVHRASRW